MSGEASCRPQREFNASGILCPEALDKEGRVQPALLPAQGNSGVLQLNSFALHGLLLVFQTVSSRNSSSIRVMLRSVQAEGAACEQHGPEAGAAGALEALGAQADALVGV